MIYNAVVSYINIYQKKSQMKRAFEKKNIKHLIDYVTIQLHINKPLTASADSYRTAYNKNYKLNL